MPKIVVFEAPRKVGFREFPRVALGPTQVRVRTLYSGISRGTELTNYRGENAGFRCRWDPELRLYLDSPSPSKTFPVESEGYEEVGEIVEVGSAVQRFAVGDRVCGVWGHWTETVVEPDEGQVRKMPQELEPILGVFLPIAAVAFNGILDARINLGETVAVFGLGVVGQIAAQMATLSGARVVGVDPIDRRGELCRDLGGAEVLLDPREHRAGEAIRGLTEGRGADVCIECTGVPKALHEAIRACAYSSRVVAMGLMTTEGVGLFLGAEFHQNRVDVVSSQAHGVDPALSHRWNGNRVRNTCLALMSRGELKLSRLISHTVPFCEAGRAFELLDQNPEETMDVVLSFEDAE